MLGEAGEHGSQTTDKKLAVDLSLSSEIGLGRKDTQHTDKLRI